MPRGVKPLPTQLKVVNGMREDRINRNDPLPSNRFPTCPEELDPEVREVWDYTLNELKIMGLASSADRDALVAYCEAVVVHRTASKDVHQNGLTRWGERGLVKNPTVAMQRDAANMIRVLASEFGLTPSSRSRIVVNREKDSDDNPFSGTGTDG